MSVKDYNLEAGLNVSISGINIAEGCAPSGINDAIRQLMADVKEESVAVSASVKTAYDKGVEGLNKANAAQTTANGKAPASHASTATTYGMGTGSNYGHVKLSDATNSTSAAGSGVAASPKAVKAAYDKAVSAFIPVGSVIAFAGNPGSAPSGFLLCNGATVSRTTYAALFSAIGTTYGAGNGSSTFALPNLTDRFIQGSGTAGTVKAAGLPDHKHTLTQTGTYQSTSQGADTVFTVAMTSYMKQVNEGRGLVDSASGSNGIYGASATVQPPALTMRYYIKY